MEYIIVNSVKGGCGKSSVSLKTAIDLARETKIGEDGKVKYANNVLVIDMDILGSSLKTFVIGDIDTKDPPYTKEYFKIEEKYFSDKACWLCQDVPNSENGAEKSVEKEWYYFTDLFTKKYDDVRGKTIETPFWVCSSELQKELGAPRIYIAFSDEDQAVKDRFRVHKSNDYTPTVNIRYYEEVLRKYIKYLKDKSLSNGKPATHIIFDMPPNSDPYSDCVFSILLKKLKDDIEENKRDSVELRLVSSCDLAHVEANLVWIRNFLTNVGWQYAFPSKLNFFVNDLTGLRKLARDNLIKTDVCASLNTKIKNEIKKEVYRCFGEITNGGERKLATISWRDKDDILLLSSAFNTCVAFSKASGGATEQDRGMLSSANADEINSENAIKGNNSKPTSTQSDTVIGNDSKPTGTQSNGVTGNDSNPNGAPNNGASKNNR